MPRFTEYWDKSDQWLETEIAHEQNLTSDRLARLSNGDKQRRTIKLRLLRSELDSRAKWKKSTAAKAPLEARPV